MDKYATVRRLRLGRRPARMADRRARQPGEVEESQAALRSSIAETERLIQL